MPAYGSCLLRKSALQWLLKKWIVRSRHRNPVNFAGESHGCAFRIIVPSKKLSSKDMAKMQLFRLTGLALFRRANAI
jgi:hypothetical protein